MTPLRSLTAAAVAVAALATPRPAAADEIAGGVVVKVDVREVYINLGTRRGVTEGAPLRFKRPVTLRHPVTRAAVVDWLPLGSATVAHVGQGLAMALPPADLLAQIRVGDVAEVYVERDEAVPVAPPTPTPTPTPTTEPAPVLDSDTASVVQLWKSQNGAPLDRRINAWEGWLSTHPESRYAAAVEADLDELRALREASTVRRARPGMVSVHLAHSAPTRAEAGRDLPLVFVIDEPSRVVSASLHYRKVGAPTYQRVLLRREGELYLRGTIPAGDVTAPGLEYFVEAAVPRGDTGAAFASPTTPVAVAVAPPPLVERFAPTRGRTRLSLMASYLDFANLDDRNGRDANEDGTIDDRSDRFYQGEIDVLYRFDGVLYGVRAGYGSYGGRGGLANAVWTSASPAPTVGFQYGYAEVEVQARPKAGPPLGLATRVYAGVGNNGFGLGLAGRLRIGHPDRSNLSLAAQTVEELGFFSDLRLETWPERRLPVGVSVGVTDQPGRGDLGVRLAADIGWRALPWLQPTVRLSWQGRTAVHYGVGGGFGLVFDW